MKTSLCILASAMLLAAPAMAQSSQNNATTAAPNMQSAASTAFMHKEGEWRASKLVGVNVYNDSNEKIGDINDLILDSSGRVANAVIGVGGFLGMGEHNVAVTFDQLKFAKEPVKTASNDGAAKTTSSTTGSARPTEATIGIRTTWC
jgi:hypothetical protein